jgi:hypothetical protein
MGWKSIFQFCFSTLFGSGRNYSGITIIGNDVTEQVYEKWKIEEQFPSACCCSFNACNDQQQSEMEGAQFNKPLDRTKP